MKTKNTARRSLRRNRTHTLFEQLESRTLFSGNMTSSVANGILNIVGNSLNNSVVITQPANAAPGSFTVSSGDGSTTINSKTTAQTFNGVTGISINEGCGNDTILVENATVTNNVQFSGAKGNQDITLNNVIIGGNLSLSNSGGQNNTQIETCSIGGSVTVSAGAGYNSGCGSCWNESKFSDANEIFTMLASTVGNNVAISNVSGETTTDIEVTSIVNNLTVTNGDADYGCWGFHCSAGSAAGDVFTLNGTTVGGNVAVTNASDGNTANIQNSTVNGNLAVNNTVGTNDQCTFSSCYSNNLANANDSFTFDGSSIGLNLSVANISDGATSDIENSSVNGGLTISDGVGSYGQSFTSTCGQNSANYGDYLTLVGTTVVNDVSVTNGSTYNSTNVQGCALSGSITVDNGLNYATTYTTCSSYGGYNNCGQIDCGSNNCGFNHCGNNSCGNNNNCGTSNCGTPKYVFTTDLFTLGSSAVANNLNVSNASGYTNTDIESSVIGNTVTVIDQLGTSYFEMNGSIVGYNLFFTAGAGVTVVQIDTSLIDNNATFTVASGASISIAAGQVTGALTT